VAALRRVRPCGDAHLGNFGFYASPEQDLVIDLKALIHHERQETQQLKQVMNLLEGLLSPPSGPSAPRKKKRRRH
jgi:hypothetical protein